MTTVQILVALRNSARFIEELLNSLIDQTEKEFQIVVSDDASTDNTLDILRAVTPRFRHPPVILQHATPSGSATANFARLLNACTADYALLADHDDVWCSDKVAEALKRLRHLEEVHGRATPILVHGDLKVVDEALNEISPSYWAFKSIKPSFGVELNTALMHATVTGCTVGMNRALIDRLSHIPPETIMHDWWINLVAVSFGVIDYDNVPRIMYRIHDSNASAPRRVTLFSMLSRLDKVRGVRKALNRRIDQAEALLKVHGDALSPDVRAVVENFVAIRSDGFVGRRRRLLAGGHLFPERWRNAAALLAI